MGLGWVVLIFWFCELYSACRGVVGFTCCIQVEESHSVYPVSGLWGSWAEGSSSGNPQLQTLVGFSEGSACSEVPNKGA